MILRCLAPRLRVHGAQCGGYVAYAPPGSLVVGLLAHSDLRSSDDHFVMPCRSCGMLHEVAPPDAAMRRTMRRATETMDEAA